MLIKDALQVLSTHQRGTSTINLINYHQQQPHWVSSITCRQVSWYLKLKNNHKNSALELTVRKFLTGLLTATPPSIRLNSRYAGGAVVLSLRVNWTGGRYVGAAEVARQTNLMGALSSGSIFAWTHPTDLKTKKVVSISENSKRSTAATWDDRICFRV